MIFIGVRNAGTEIEVSGETYPVRFELSSLGLKFLTSRNVWRGPASLKSLRNLENVSGAMLSHEARQAIEELQVAEKKRKAYQASRRRRL